MKKKERKTYNKAYYEANKEKIRVRAKAYRDNLADGYIASVIKIPLEDLKPYPVFIDCKRIHLKILREIKRQIEEQKQITASNQK